MHRVDYNQRLHKRFHEGRVHDASVMDHWGQVALRCVGTSSQTVLDLGSGTGRFSGVLSNALDATVIGVEPSHKMRQVAQSELTHPDVRFVAGSADAIPLHSGSCDVAWLSQIVHHLIDLPAVAAELRRVLAPGGKVLIRNNFKGRLAEFSRFYEFFPSCLSVDEARHPSVDRVRDTLEARGLRLRALETIEQREAGSLAEYAKRIRLRTYSSFELISESEYEQGLKTLLLAAESETTPEPVMAKVDLLVFDREA